MSVDYISNNERFRPGRCAHCMSKAAGGLCAAMDFEGVDGQLELDAAPANIRVLQHGEVIYRQGDGVEMVYQVISGWVALHRDLADGRRHNTQFLTVGLPFGIEPTGVATRNHGATAVTSVVLCAMRRSTLDRLRSRHPAFNERFVQLLERQSWLATEEQTMLGQCSAIERIARLLWLLAVRVAGTTDIKPYAEIRFPLIQRHIAEATGLTPIHVNRVLKRLREKGVVRLTNGMMIVENPSAFSALAAADEAAALWTDFGLMARSIPTQMAIV